MALLEEQFTETLDAGAPDITYQGNEGKEQKIARQLWDQLPNQVRMQFGSFEQFFQSGAWKQVLAKLQEAQQQTPERIQETETIEEQPQQGLAGLMPAQMSDGGRLMASAPSIEDSRNEMALQLFGKPLHQLTPDELEMMEEYNKEKMAYGGIAGLDGRRAYGWGSKFKKAFKKVTKPFKKIAKSPLGKAALMYAGTAGLGNLAGGLGGAQKWGSLKWLKPTNVMGNLFGSITSGGGTDVLTKQGLFNKLNLTKTPGSMMPTALGWGTAASLAPFAMAATGNWDTGEEDLSKFAEGDWDFDYKGMIRDIQAAQATGLESEVAKVMAKYNLSRGDMPGSKYIGTAAEGGRIGYDNGGDVGEWYEYHAERLFGKPYHELTETELIMFKEEMGKAQGGRIGYQDGGWAAREKQELISKLVNLGLPLPQAMKMADMIIENTSPEELRRALEGTRQQGLTPEESVKFQETIETPREDISVTDRAREYLPDIPQHIPLKGNINPALMGRMQQPEMGRMQQPEISEMVREQLRTPELRETIEEIKDYLPKWGGDAEQVPGMNEGGLMSLGGNEMDLRGGGFVPIGAKEKADDVPARLSKNEFVFTADAVRAAGGGDVDKGADKMYNTMKQLESRVG